MPYTISHTALVLPFTRLLARWRVLAAVLIGSMVPDFGIFTLWRLGRFETHSLSALITFCLPVGLLTYWVFQFLIKPAMAEILPDGPYMRWRAFAAPEPVSSPRQWLLAACGILAGAVSHLVLDGFTHSGGRGILMFPALDEPLFDIGRHHIMATRLTQDLGSLVGLVIVLAVVLRGLRRGHKSTAIARRLTHSERQRWALGYALAMMALSVLFYFTAQEHYEPASHQIMALIYDGAVAALRGLGAAVLGVSLILTARLRAGR